MTPRRSEDIAFLAYWQRADLWQPSTIPRMDVARSGWDAGRAELLERVRAVSPEVFEEVAG